MKRLYKFLVLIFVLSSFANAFAANFTVTWTSIALSNPCGGLTSSYTLTATNTNNANAVMNAGVLVTINFPAGTNANTCITGNGSTYNGVAIAAITNVSATQITFLSPVAVGANAVFSVVLNNVTNMAAGVSNLLVMTAPNFSAGTNTFNNRNYTVNPQTITTGPVSTPICKGATVNVPFTEAGCGLFAGGNTFTAQLSDAAGSFAAPVNIGTLVGTGSGTIAATIPAGTPTGIGYRIRVVGSTPVVTGTSNSNGNITISTPMIYASSAVAQISTNISRNCPLTSAILEIQVVVTGSCTPLSITQFNFNTTGTPGSTNPATDISKAKVYYTGQTQGFTTATQFGTEFTLPSGAFTINGVQPLSFGAGTYYFYLTYDVPATSTVGDVVDASVTSFVLGGSTILSMTTPDPAGSRTIVNGSSCTYTITQFPDLNFCGSVYTIAADQTVSFTLNESAAKNEFDANQAAQTIVLTLPTGFKFDAAGGVTFTAGGNITAAVLSPMVAGVSTVTVTVTTNGAAATLDNIKFNAFKIYPTQPGSGDLLRTGGTFTVEGSTGNPTSSESFGHMLAGPPEVYISSSVGQYTTANIDKNCTNTTNPILEVQVNISNPCPPVTITQFNFNTTGCTNPVTDITEAEIYYTGQTQGFSYDNWFGLTAAPNGAFTINGSQPLTLGAGTYYFYLVYDVPATATVTNTLDASMTSFVINGVTETDMSTPNPAGSRTIVTGTCTPTPDVLNPPPNPQTVKAGSLVIPMDNAHQNLFGGRPFNLKAYGLVNELLQNDIPLKWVITSGKAKDAPDFIANASRVYPSVVAAATQTFVASEFIVDSFYVNNSFYAGGKTATQVITAFEAVAPVPLVAVYQLTASQVVDVRYNLTARPKIAVFSNGTFQAIPKAMLDTARIRNYVVENAGDFTGLADCFTFCAEAHWVYTVGDPVLGNLAPVQNVIDFVNEGGNFLAMCAGIDLYENHQPGGGHFQTTNGVIYPGNAQLAVNASYNPDMAFNQYQGTVLPEAGVIASFWTPASSVYKPEMYYGVSTPAVTNTVVATAAHLADPDSVGSNVYYLGGHSYASNVIGDINGSRMFLNAALVPAHRPHAFQLNPGANSTICAGNSTTLGCFSCSNPAAPPAIYVWSPATGLNNTTSPNPIASPTVTTVYTVIANNNGCLGGPNTVTVTVNPTPAAPTPVGSNSPVCSGNTLSLTATTIGGATYAWTGPNSFSSAIQNPTIAGVTTAASGTYTVIASLGACPGPAATTSVTINQTPVAPVAGSNSTVCSGNTLSLTASNIGGAAYAWTGPNSFSSAVQNPTIAGVTTAASGTYSVTATVGGCTGVAGTVSVTINQTPAAPIAGSNSAVCSGTTLSLTANNIGGATYAWTGPNSFSSAVQNPTIAGVTVAASGTYSVTATVGGCTGPTGTTAVTINPTPAAPVAGSNSTVCSGNTLSLTANTIAGATYAWTGPNSFSSAVQNPTIAGVTTAASGTYSVTATVGGCTGPTGTTAVTINQTPSAPVAGSNSTICSGQTLSLTASTIAGATYSWNGPNSFSSGSQNPTIAGATTAASGTYFVAATVGGCIGSAGTTTVTVNPLPAPPVAGSNSTVCVGNTLSLSASTIAGATYSWTGPNSFSSASQNPTIAGATTAASGTYSVAATVGGCAGPAGTTAVTVNPIPVAPAAGNNSPICTGNTLSLTANNIGGATYAWTGPNSFSSASQNPTIAGATTAASGTYSVTVTVGGCTGAAGTTTVTINPPPAAPIAGSNSAICSGQTLSLTSSTIAGASVYNWTGPNSFSSASQNPTIAGVTTAASGTYSVTATVPGCGSSPIGTTVVTVNQTPSAPTAGSNSPLCEGNTLSLTASTIAGATYSWNGPNSFSSASQNPTIAGATIAASGNYSVTATASGCTGPAGTTSVTVNPLPAAPTPGSNSPVCSGQTLSLTASNIAGATYNWTGPNSFSSALQNPTIAGVTTAASGTYTISATVSGCTGSIKTVTVTINQTPAAPIAGSNSPLCVGATLSLTASTIAGATYSWNGPNSFSSASQNPTIAGATTAAAGTYSVTATAAGCTGPAGTTSVTVAPPPAAPTAGSNTPVCSGQTLSLTANTIGGATYSWNGPNSFSSASQNPTIAGVTTAASGTYSVTVNVGGCTGATGTTSVTINQTPVAPVAVSNSPLCAGNTLSLTASNTGATYSWNGPNSFSSALQNPTIAAVTTAASGTYSVTATTTGCTSAAGTTSVTINPPPSPPAAGNNSPICSGTTLSLTASTVAGATYAWTGPNSFSSASQNPTIAGVTTAASGTYSVIATVAGCPPLTTITTTVTINQTPSAPVAGSNSPICVGGTLSLTASTIAGATYTWTGPNSFSSASQNPTLAGMTTANSGTYSVIATAAGCTGPAGTTAVVVNPPPGAPITGSNSPICSGNTLSLTASTIAGATYAWTGPNSFSSASQNPTIAGATTAASGTYSVTATVPGCSTSPAGTTTVTINQTPAAPVAGSNSPICAGSTLSLTASTIAGATYAWTGPNSFSSASQNPTIAGATTAASGTYSVIATASGCTGPAGTISATVNPIPVAPTAGSNSPVCVGGTLSLTANNIAGATYAWNGPNSFSSASQNPTIAGVVTADAGTYSVNVTVSGCAGPVGTTAVIINPPPAAPATGSNSPVCSGQTLSLTASTVVGASTYNWSGPNSFISVTQNPTIAAVTTLASGTYSVTATVPGCITSPAGTTTVTINQTPAAPTAGNNGPLCTGDILTLTANTIAGATYAWSGPNSFSSASQNPTIAGVTTTEAGTYSVVATAAGCTGPVGVTSVTIAPPPSAPTAGSNSPVCSGQTLNLTASPIGGATYTWNGPNSFSSASQNPTIAGVTTAASGTYSVIATIGSCKGTAGTTSVTINQTPAVPTAGSNSPICAGNTLSLTASTVGGSTYSWSGPNSFSSASQNPTIAGATTAASGIYSVTATEFGCTGPAGTTSATINPIPTAPVAGNNGPLCTGTTLSLTANTIAGATYSWSGPNGFTSASQNPTIAGVTTAEAGTYSVSVTVSGCAGPAGTTSVTITPPPVAPTAGSNSPVCSGNILSLTASAIGGATYNWNGPNSFSSGSQNPTISGATTAGTGTYSVTATVSGCIGPVGTIVVTVNQTPAAPVAGSNSPICDGSDLSLTASTVAGTTYSWSGPNGFSSASQNPVITPTTTSDAGTYTVNVTSIVNGCVSNTSTTTIIINTIPAAPVAGSNSTVCSGNTLSLTSNTIAGATYAWSGPNSFSSALQNPTIAGVTTAASGTYSVHVTVSGCAGPDGTTNVTINQTPIAPTAGSNSPICAGNDLSLTANTIGGATYSWNGPSAFTSSSQNPVITPATIVNSGTYSVTVTVGGCMGIAGTTSVTVNPIPAAPIAGSNSPICEGNTLSLAASNIAGATYSWSGPNGFTSASQNPTIPGITSADAGTYSVTATVNGCVGPAGINLVIVNPIPSSPTAGNNSPICSGNTLSLTASTVGGATYHWSGPNSFSSGTQNSTIAGATTAASGNYSVTATVSGCTSPAGTTSVTINQTPAAPVASNNGPLCIGDNLSLTAGTIAGATYSWSGPNSFSDATQNPVVNNVSTADGGTYSVTATANGCIGPAGTTAVIVSPPPTIPITGSNSPVCSGQTLSLTSNIFVGGTYSWSGPNSFSSASQNPTIAGVTTAADGTYSVNVKIGSCTSPTGTVSVTINQTPVAPAASSNAPICAGNDLSLTANTVGGSTYNWTGPNSFSSASQNPVISPAATADGGTYSVTATENGCTGSAGTTSVTINPIPSAPVAGNNGPLCLGDNLSLTANTIVGATYAWSGPNGFSSASQNPTIAGVSTDDAGTYSVSVSVSGCPGTAGTTTVIVAPPPATPIAGSNAPICSGQMLSLTASTIVGASYTWSGPNTFSSATQNPTIAAITTAADGIYSVTASIGSCTSSPGTTSVTVSQTPTAPTAASNSPICLGNDLSLTASTVGGSTYSWTGPNSFSDASQNPVVNGVTTAEAGTYSVVATENGCSGPAGTITVVINIPPVAPIAGSNSPLCSGQTLSLTANTILSATYNWNGPNTFTSATQNPTIGSVTTAADGTYSVTATVPGCPVSPAGTVSVTINQTPVAPSASSNAPICSGSDLSLTASTVGGATYNWTGPNSFSSASQNPAIIAATTSNTGTYSVTATENGCTGPAGTTSVTINPIPSAPTAGNNGPLCVGDNLSLTANTIAGATYSWDGPNGFSSVSQNPVINGVGTADAGTYSVSVSVAGCSGAVGTTTVIVAPPPSTPIAGSNSPVCSGYGLSLTANTIVGASYTWNGPNSFSSSTQDPTITGVTLAANGTYSVIIMIGSCTSPAGIISVTVNPSPSAPTVGSNSPLCVGDNLSLTASTIAGTTYEWSGPNSFTSASQDTVINGVTTANAGTYSVSVTSIADGCVSPTSTLTVSITFPAVVNAGTDQTVCANNSAQLNGTITGGSGTGIWSTPNGVGFFAPTTTALNATYTPSINDTLVGNVLLVLSSTNNGGCSAATDTVIIHVNRGPVVNAGADQSICSNNYSAVSINGTVHFAAGGIWSTMGTGTFQSANTILTNTYVPSSTDSLNGSVILILSSTGNGSCSAVNDSLKITFTPAPLVNAGANIPVCFGDTSAQLNGTVSGGATTGVWSSSGTGFFSPNNTTLNATYFLSSLDTAAKGVTLVLTSTNFGNCFAVTDTVLVTMTTAPIVAAGSDITVCANKDTVSLNGTISGGGSTGYWATSGTGTFTPDSSALNANYIPSAADTAAGSITLTLASTNGCRVVKDSLILTISNAPVVSAGADVSICQGVPVALNGSVSSAATGGQWTTSGNGTFTPDNLTLNASYVPGSNDTSTVTLVLTSTGNGQCRAVTDTMKITIGRKPIAAFTNAQICTGQSVIFTDASTVVGVGNTIVSWNWTIGGSSFVTQNPSNVYAAAGTDSVTLIVTTNIGCSDTVWHKVTIHPTPVASYTATSVCDTAFFTNTSTISTGNIISYSWNFGDGNNSAIQNPVHTYSASGTYTVALTVVSDSGCSNTFSNPIIITPCCTAPTPSFVVSGSCLLSPVAFADSSSVLPGDTINSWNWNFGDGNNSTIQNPSHTYTASGTYTVQLVIATAHGCSDSVKGTVIINPSPVASFTVFTSCSLDSVYFTNTSTISGGNIISWNWNFGDTHISTVQNPVHHYDSTGVYIVSLTITSDSGCTAIKTDTVNYAKAITAGFKYISDCKFNVAFKDTTVPAAGDSIVAWNWSFPGGTPSTANTPTAVVTYSVQGSYSATLTVNTAGGCSGSKTDTIVLLPPAIADFTPAGEISNVGVEINFTDHSANAVSWNWNFGDGVTDTIQNPSHTYTLTATLDVVLIVMNSAGCPDTAKYSFIINTNTVAIPSAFTPNGDGVNDILYIRGGPMKEMDWKIYNEWGNELFHATTQDQGWDGTFKGKYQEASRYIYTLVGTTFKGEKIDMKGNVTIIR